jgi:integrase
VNLQNIPAERMRYRRRGKPDKKNNKEKKMGTINKRPLRNGEFSYQAIVKIKGAKSAVRSFPDREQAQAFIDQVEASKAKVAKEWEARWLRPLAPGEQEDRNQEMWANEWLKTTLKLYAESERITNRFKQPMRTIIKFGGDVKLGELNRTWVRDYIKHARRQKTRTREPYKWATIVDHMKIISAAINWRAEEMEARGAKLPFSLKMIPSNWEVKRDRRLEPEEERMIIQRFKGKRKHNARYWLRLFRLALNTAARLQELVLAEWREFDLGRRIWIIPAEHTKCGVTRLVPLTLQAVRALRVMSLVRISESNRVFHMISTPKSASNIFSKMTMGLGIRDLRFHDLRHEAISRIVLKQRHLSVFEIMKIVGHSSIEMLNRYANLRGEELSRKLID